MEILSSSSVDNAWYRKYLLQVIESLGQLISLKEIEGKSVTPKLMN